MAQLNVAELKQRVLLQKAEPAGADDASSIIVWSDVIKCWAALTNMDNVEKSPAQNKRPTAKIRYRSDVHPLKNRIVHDGVIYNIIHVNNVDGANKYLELLLYRAVVYTDGVCDIYAPDYDAALSAGGAPPAFVLSFPFARAEISAEEWYAANAQNIALKQRIMTLQDERIIPGVIALIGKQQYKIARVEHADYEDGTPVTNVTLAQPDRYYFIGGDNDGKPHAEPAG